MLIEYINLFFLGYMKLFFYNKKSRKPLFTRVFGRFCFVSVPKSHQYKPSACYRASLVYIKTTSSFFIALFY